MSVIADKPTQVRYGVLAFACALSMITYLDRVCFGTVASNIKSEFGLTESGMGWLFTAFAFSYAMFEVPTGWLGDKYGAEERLSASSCGGRFSPPLPVRFSRSSAPSACSA